jgi:mycothiol synthase
MQQQKNIDKEIAQLPSGLSVRPATQDDLPAIVDLFASEDIAQSGRSLTTADTVRTLLLAPDVDMARETWLVFSPQGQPVAFALLGNMSHVRFDVRLKVHPDYNDNDDIGRALLQLVEDRAREQLSQAESGARVTLSCWISSSNTARNHLLADLGFHNIRQFWIMKTTLTEPPAAVHLPEGITVQTMQPGMERVVYQAVEDGFSDHWGHLPLAFEQWQQWEMAREAFDPSLWFLAMDGDKIAALCLCADEAGEGWVNDLAVLRSWRRQGLGLALLQYAFGLLYARGLHEIYLNVDAQSLTGATRLYTRAGMHVYRRTNVFEKELRPGKELSTQFLE